MTIAKLQNAATGIEAVAHGIGGLNAVAARRRRNGATAAHKHSQPISWLKLKARYAAQKQKMNNTFTMIII